MNVDCDQLYTMQQPSRMSVAATSISLSSWGDLITMISDQIIFGHVTSNARRRAMMIVLSLPLPPGLVHARALGGLTVGTCERDTWAIQGMLGVPPCRTRRTLTRAVSAGTGKSRDFFHRPAQCCVGPALVFGQSSQAQWAGPASVFGQDWESRRWMQTEWLDGVCLTGCAKVPTFSSISNYQ